MLRDEANRDRSASGMQCVLHRGQSLTLVTPIEPLSGIARSWQVVHWISLQETVFIFLDPPSPLGRQSSFHVSERSQRRAEKCKKLMHPRIHVIVLTVNNCTPGDSMLTGNQHTLRPV